MIEFVTDYHFDYAEEQPSRVIIRKTAALYLSFRATLGVGRCVRLTVLLLNPPGLRGAPGYSLEQAHHLPIEMDPLIGQCILP